LLQKTARENPSTRSGDPSQGSTLTLGARGEDVAVEHLVKAGYRILDRNWRCRLGQADIVAADKQVLVLVEVKARRGTGFGVPQEGVDARKRAKLSALLHAYRLQRGLAAVPCRIDVIGVLFDRLSNVVDVQHIVNAVTGD